MKSQLYLWSKLREKLVAEIELFRDTYAERVQPVFANVEEEADKIQENYYNQFMSTSVEDYNCIDPGDIADSALQLGLDYYEKYSLMRYNNLAMWIAMLYQYWEQQVRLFLFNEERHTFEINFKDFCSKGIAQIIEEFRFHKINLEDLKCWEDINILRLVCNTLKHGDGGAAQKLKQIEPKFFIREGLKDYDLLAVYKSTLLYEVLNISDEDFRKFCNSLIEFWRELPESMYSDEIIE